jgi:hypothetical protein
MNKEKLNKVQLSAKEFRKLTETKLKELILQKANEKRKKSLKRDFWLQVIKENYEDIKRAKEKRKLSDFFNRLRGLKDFERFKISFAYFTKLIREYENGKAT